MKNKVKMKFMRITAMLLCILMLVSSLPITALAAELGGIASAIKNTNSSLMPGENATSGSSAQMPMSGNTDETAFFYTTDAYLPTGQMTTQYTSVTVVNGKLDIGLYNSFPALTVSEDVYVEKDLIVNGISAEGNILTVNGDLIVGGNLTLNNCTLQMTEGSNIYVGGSIITLNSATVDRVAYMGFAEVNIETHIAGIDHITGEKTLRFTNATLNNIAVVGVKYDSAATVGLIGSFGGVNYAVFADYPFTYFDNKQQEIANPTAAGLPEHYRVCHSESSYFVGLHYNNVIKPEPNASSQTLTLPADGGWEWKSSADSEAPITAVDITALGQPILLYAHVIPNDVIISYALGYTPSGTSNDDPDAVFMEYSETFIQQEGSLITLKTPWRMGYEFNGWKVTTGSGKDEYIVISPVSGEDYTCNLATEWVDHVNGVHTLAFEAVWEAKRYPVTFQVAPAPDSSDYSKLLIQVDRVEGWLTVAEFSEKYDAILRTHDSANHTMDFNIAAEYGTSFADYIEDLGFECFEIKFEGSGYYSEWRETFRNIGLDVVNGSFVFGANGFFGSKLPDNITNLNTFEHMLSTTQMPVFQPKWVNLNSSIIFNNNTWSKIWSVWVSTKDAQGSWQEYVRYTPVNNILANIPAGAKVQLRAATSNSTAQANFGLWTLTVNGNRISVKEGLYKAGDAYYSYEFIVPVENVTANYTSNPQDNKLNLKYSPITDAEITVNGITRFGFWTNELLTNASPVYDVEGIWGYGCLSEGETVTPAVGYCNNVPQELRYFYEWPKFGTMYITTGDANTVYEDYDDGTKNGTQNQYYAKTYLANNNNTEYRKIYLVDCHLWATDIYSALNEENPSSTYWNASMRQQACNIFYTIGGSGSRVETYFEGDNNIVAAIGQENLASWMYLYSAKKNEQKKVKLGTLIGAGYQMINDLDITAYEHPTYKDNSKHLTLFMNTYVRVNGCRIDLPTKAIRQCNFSDSTVNLGRYIGGSTGFGLNNSIMVVDHISFSYQFSITNGSSLIVKKTVGNGYTNYNAVSEINTTGLVLIMPDRLATPHLNIKNGTVLANTISTNALRVEGGTLVLNNLRNMINGAPNKTVSQNGDQDFMGVYGVYTDYNEETTGLNKVAWRFTGGDVYLMGYINSDASLRGTSERADDPSSPLKRLFEGYEFTNIDTFQQDIEAVLAASTEDSVREIYRNCCAMYSENECVILGNSNNPYNGTKGQSFLFDGASIYAAGRMTLFNKTDITGGSIEARVLSCKQDMTISGGEITANELGNNGIVLVGETGQKHYASTLIIGGTVNGVTKLGVVTPSAAYTSSVDNRSHVTVGGNAVVNTKDGALIPIDRDTYINYPSNVASESYYNSLPDTSTSGVSKANYAFTMPDDMPIYINVSGIGDPNDYLNVAWTSDSDDFEHATYLADAAQPYKWSLSAADAKLVTGYTNGMLQGDGLTEQEIGLFDNRVSLYLYIVMPREITVYQDSDVIATMTINGEQQPTLAVGNNTFTVDPTDSLVFTLNRSMKDRVVFWYKDGNGVYRNLMQDGVVSDDGQTVTVRMPNLGNVELYICDELKLYFNKTEIQINNDGFYVEIDPVREDAKFKYSGGLYITRDDGKVAFHTNRIVFSEAYQKHESRPITFRECYCHVDVRANSDVTIFIDGKQEFKDHEFKGSTNCNLEFVGKNPNRTDILKGSYIDIEHTKTTTLRNLTTDSSSIFLSGRVSEELKILDCNIPLLTHMLCYAEPIPKVTIERSNIYVSGTNGLQRLNATGIMTIKDSVINGSVNQLITCAGWNVKPGNIVLDNTLVNVPNTMYYTAPSLTEQENELIYCTSLVMKNGSVYYCPTGILVNTSVMVDSDSKLYVGTDPSGSSYNGRLMCPCITADNGGSIYAKYVVCSGYGTTASVADAKKVSGAYVEGIAVNGGKINAYFIGGDKNAVITMTDGSVTAKYIGTMGKYIYNGIVDASNPVEFVLNSMVCNSTINITACTVNLSQSGVLGGGTSTVTLKDSTVNLAQSGVLGGGTSTVTLKDSTVNAEAADITGRTVTVSGAGTKIHADSITALGGSVTISGTTAHNYDNFYPEQIDRKHPYVAVLIESELTAQRLVVDGGALVYAKNAFASANAGQSSHYTVAVGAALYTSTYGTTGDGDHSDAVHYIPSDENGNQTIWGIQAISIVYEIYGDYFDGFAVPEGSDRDFIGVNTNPDYYNFGSNGGSITLAPLTHPYYEFIGWFYADGTAYESINTHQIPSSYTRTFYAKWKPKEVKFRVELPATLLDDASAGISGEKIIASEVRKYLADGSAELKYDPVRCVWVATFSIPYYQLVNTEDRYTHGNYQLYSYRITGAKIIFGAENRQIDSDTIVTRAMLEAYEALLATEGEGAALVIELNMKDKTVSEIKFYLNQNELGRPADAEFTQSPESTNSGYYTLRADIGYQVNEIAGYDIATAEGALKATGYTFIGWSNDTQGSNLITSAELQNMRVDGSFSTAWYAVWQANKYWIKFEAVPYNGEINADGVYYFDETDSGKRPDEEGFRGDPYTVKNGIGEIGSTVSHAVVRQLTYDNYLNQNYNVSIPAAFRMGSVFDGWYYHKENGEQIKIVTEQDLLNANIFDVSLFESMGTEDAPAFILYAHYRRIEVTYDLGGAVWKDGGTDLRTYEAHTTDAKTMPLAAYSNAGGLYGFVSTTATEYIENGRQFNADDYRFTLQKHGYTFEGWYTEDGRVIASTPLYSDVKVYARWSANKYEVRLYSHDAEQISSDASFVKKDGEAWVNNDAEYGSGNGISVELEIGQPINVSLLGASAWPSRDVWGTVKPNAGNNVSPRQLWGFTFFPLDPTTPDAADAYTKYNQLCMELYNQGHLFVKNESAFGGNVFALPKQYVAADGSVYGYDSEDLPNGSELAMFAQYREYALVFVQYYLDEYGSEIKIMSKTVLYGEISETTLAVPTLQSPGEEYELINWYVNTTAVDGKQYASSDVRDRWTEYLQQAKELGTYDITVYAVYGAHKTVSGTNLTADSEAHTDTAIITDRIAEVPIPMNMQADKLTYSLAGFEDLNFVSKDILDEMLYDFSKANQTVTLTVTVLRDGSEIGSYDLLRNGDTLSTVKGGDVLRLTLYHSYVMSADTVFAGDVKFTFANIGADKQYLLLDETTLKLMPSIYDLSFNSNIPQASEITSNGSFVRDDVYSDILEKKGNLKDNNPFLGVEMPTLIGYRLDGVANTSAQIWYSDADCTNELLRIENGVMRFTGTPVFDADGKLKLYGKWSAIEYKLTIDEAMSGWTITNLDTSEVLAVGTHDIPYGTEITFANGTVPEFVLLHYETLRDRRLEIDIPEINGEYRWTMPYDNTTVRISTVMELYLEDGSITITGQTDATHSYYYQDGWVKWPIAGSYNILMDKQNNTDGSSTSNTLSLNGDLKDVSISLGNLKVTAPDSISLAAGRYTDHPEGVMASNGTNVVLNLSCMPNGALQAGASDSELANILVPEASTLTINGTSGARLVFAPAEQTAAIGKLSGGENSEITVQNCTVSVNQRGDYTGIWFGGYDTKAVTFKNVIVEQITPDNYAGGRYLTYAETVTLENCNLGTETNPVSEPVYAKNALNIIGGKIYSKVWVPLGAGNLSAIGTVGGMTTVEKGTDSAIIKVLYESNGQTNSLFTGTFVLKDKDAEVVIDNTLLIEMGHGDLTISDNSAVQGEHGYSFGGNYFLLSETVTETAPSLTVNSMSAKDITVMSQKNTTDFKLDALTITTDVTIRFVRAEAQSGVTLDMTSVSIADGKTLTVKAGGASGTVRLAGNAMLNAQGNYVQDFGALTSTGDVGGQALDMMLNNVRVDVKNLYAENLTLNGCKVTCEGGKVGSYGIENGTTTVILSGSTDITAAIVGALGEENKRFTKVVSEGTNVYVTGKLVRDIYRIAYVVQDMYTQNESTKFVLRTEESFNGTTPVSDPMGTVAVYSPTVQDGKTNRFITWYVKEGSIDKRALLPKDSIGEKYQNKFTAFQNGLSVSDIVYAVEDENGIPTVTVYAFYSVSGTVVLKEDEKFLLSDFADGVLALHTVTDMGWSALFNVEATGEEGEDYAVSFQQALPVGTRLILVWLDRASGKPMYYYYSVDGEGITSILFSEFTALASSEKFTLGAAANENERFILTVDYTYANVSAVLSHTLSFGYKAADQTALEQLCTATVEVDVASQSGAVAWNTNNTAITVTIPQNALYTGKTYAVLVKADKDFLYNVSPKLGDMEGKLIGGDMILFVIGNYNSNDLTDTFTVMGLPENYTLIWTPVLLEHAEQVNIWKRLSTD